MHAFARELRHAWRSLVHRKAYFVACAGTLGLVLGANAAMFAVVNATMLRPLPFATSGPVVQLFGQPPGTTTVLQRNPLQQMELPRLRERARTLARLEGFYLFERVVTLAGEPGVAAGATVTPGLLRMMAAPISQGRSFTAGEEEPGHFVALITDRYWRETLGSGSVVGTSLIIDDQPHTIVGILSPALPCRSSTRTSSRRSSQAPNRSAALRRAPWLRSRNWRLAHRSSGRVNLGDWPQGSESQGDVNAVRSLFPDFHRLVALLLDHLEDPVGDASGQRAEIVLGLPLLGYQCGFEHDLFVRVIFRTAHVGFVPLTFLAQGVAEFSLIDEPGRLLLCDFAVEDRFFGLIPRIDPGSVNAAHAFIFRRASSLCHAIRRELQAAN